MLLLSDATVPLGRADPADGERRNIIRVRGQQQLCRLLYMRQQVHIAHQIGHAQLRKPRLTGAEQLARPAQFQIPTSNLKAIVGLANGL